MSERLTEWLELHDERFRRLVLGNAPVQVLSSGYRWLEGPVWFADQQCLYVSDLPSDEILRWTEASGVSPFRRPAGFPNGKARDRQGRMIGCSHHDRCIWRIEPDGSTTVLASHYGGNRLNSPNDIVCRSDDSIWFTDPPYGIQSDYEGGKQVQEQPARVYRLDPDRNELRIVVDDIVGPNGLAFSPDERWLYVSETGDQFASRPDRRIRRFAVMPDGELGTGKDFHRVEPGYADGFRVDEDGHLWASAGDGVHCIAPDGTLLGKILTGTPVANLCFGDRERSRLFLCASHALMAVFVNARGCVRP